ncbi:YigZ family protein [Pedobacter sp. SYSU D00535]|uniref:IMPACT family protein n=1 Tax=Pedobacter sp. SYSU D00535 TaxID=2810308 RepID=UPI001A968F95|nr:YigZ family protein [Pedobacter sp. SYSU D00535]
MLFDDKYKTIEKPLEGIFRDRGSKFIAYAFPVRSEEQAKMHVSQLKEEHPKARHHCWALRLSPDRNVFRLNDDGEPSGTAGRPILNVILSNDLTNICVVVVRYFGGTLLGVPGLINAYKTATAEALKLAEVIELSIKDVYSITFDYLQMNVVMKTIKDENLKIRRQEFENICTAEIEIPKSQLNSTLGKFEKIESLKLRYISTI